MLSPSQSPLTAHPASLFPHSASRDPAEHPVLATDRHPHAHSGTAARQLPGVGGCLYALAICPWLWRPCSPLASNPPGSTCSSHSAGDAAPALPLPACPPAPAHSVPAPVPGTALVPHRPHCHSSPPRCRGSGTAGSVQGSCHGTRCTGNMAEPGSLPPACGQPARPGKARDSLGLPAQEPFPPAPAGHSPTGGSSLASSFQAGAGGLGSGLSCASPGRSPSSGAQGWAMPGGAVGHHCLAGHGPQQSAPGEAAGPPPSCLSCLHPGRQFCPPHHGSSWAGCWLPAAGGEGG